MPLPKIAVVLLSWNGRHFLEQFLPSVTASTYGNLDIIIVDNGSSDDTLAFLGNGYPSLRVIHFEQNLGFTRAYNRALKQIEAAYYVLLNSDVEVTAGWLEPMARLLESDRDIAACQPKLLAYKNKELFEYAGAAGGWLDKYGYPFAKGRIFDICEKDLGQYEQEEPIFWASGAALFIRAAVFHEVRGFDEYFFAHQEEIDLCWRIQLSGYKIYTCPSSVVYHVGGGTLPKGNSLKTYLNFRNNKIMLAKNLPFRSRFWVMSVRNVLDFISAFKGLLNGDGGYFLAIMRAHAAFGKWWWFHRKKALFPVTRQRPLSGHLQKNIAWLHFVRKKKTFSEIVSKTN